MAIEKKSIPSRLNDLLRHSSFLSALATFFQRFEDYRRSLGNFFVFGLLTSLFLRGITSIYDFVKAKNKNLFELPKLGIGVASMLYTIGFGALIFLQPFSGLGGLTFLFISAYALLGVEAIYQVGGLFYNLTKALLAPTNSIERSHHLQAAFRNLNIATISVLILGIVIFAEATPIIAPLALAAISLTALTLVWDLIPPLRKLVKFLLHIDKPKIDMDFTKDLSAKIDSAPRSDLDKAKEDHFHKSFFGGRAYRKAMVVDYLKSHRPDAALAYLKEQLDNKIASYEGATGSRQIAKQRTLIEAQKILGKHDAKASDIQSLIDNADNKVHQSFFSDTSDTDDLLEAARTYLQHKPAAIPPLANLNTVDEGSKVALMQSV